MITFVPNVQWWLAELDQYGNPTLIDGAHSERQGADQAAYLIRSIGLGGGKARSFAVAKVELTEVDGHNHGVVNEESIAACRMMVEVADAGHRAARRRG
jgi:hypothetical protein